MMHSPKIPAGILPGNVTLRPEGAAFNARGYTRLVLDVGNTGRATAHIRVRAENDGATDWGASAINDGYLRPKQRERFNLYFYFTAEERARFPDLKRFTGMNGLPGGAQSHWHTIDRSAIRAIKVEVVPAETEQAIKLRSVEAAFPAVPPSLVAKPDAFFPFVDRYGQYVHDTWPGKVTSDADLKRIARKEAADLAANPGPKTWSRFGGNAAGKRFTASGFFPTEKRDGKWWLVDPEGYPFWSHGADCVGYDSARTPVARRENYYQWLAPKTGETAFAWAGNDYDALAMNLNRQFGNDKRPPRVTWRTGVCDRGG